MRISFLGLKLCFPSPLWWESCNSSSAAPRALPGGSAPRALDRGHLICWKKGDGPPFEKKSTACGSESSSVLCFPVFKTSESSELNISMIFFYQRRQWQPTPVLLPGKSHGWSSLGGCSPWGCEESDTTEQCHFQLSLSCTGEGNGKPPQCSCLENPRDGRAWWAAIYGVAQSWTRLKRLSSSMIFFNKTQGVWKSSFIPSCLLKRFKLSVSCLYG